ncbi:MAG TPA: trypsin-like serine protease [Clostridiales bacterium]|nr:trypsin-like serine protease [Clostridiales bacterium]
MHDSFDFDDDFRKKSKKRRNYIGYVALLLVGILIGAVLVHSIFTSGMYGQQESSGIHEGQTTDIKKSEEKAAEEENTGVSGMYEIFEDDNPVVEIAQKVGPAVVGVTNKVTMFRNFLEDSVEAEQGTGSGIIISSDGYIVTNNHVIEGATKIGVMLPGGEQVEAQLIGRDARTDLAVIKVNAEGLTAAKLGNSDKIRPGELAVAIGNPLGHQLAGSVTVGVISAVGRTLQVDGKTLNLIQTDAAINPGNSGGALVNRNGEVIGINTLKQAAVGVEGLGFAIPINDAKPIIEQLIEYGYISRPGMGIWGTEITEQAAKEYNVPTGILVRRVVADGAAAKAGIIPGDIIIEMEGKPIKTFDELNKILQNYKVNDDVDLVIWRDGKRIELTLTLGELKD